MVNKSRTVRLATESIFNKTDVSVVGPGMHTRMNAFSLYLSCFCANIQSIDSSYFACDSLRYLHSISLLMLMLCVVSFDNVAPVFDDGMTQSQPQTMTDEGEGVNKYERIERLLQECDDDWSDYLDNFKRHKIDDEVYCLS
eukprot:52124_1